MVFLSPWAWQPCPFWPKGREPWGGNYQWKFVWHCGRMGRSLKWPGPEHRCGANIPHIYVSDIRGVTALRLTYGADRKPIWNLKQVFRLGRAQWRLYLPLRRWRPCSMGVNSDWLTGTVDRHSPNRVLIPIGFLGAPRGSQPMGSRACEWHVVSFTSTTVSRCRDRWK